MNPIAYQRQSLTDIARDVRKSLIQMHSQANASHIGSALSCVDILVALYFDVMEPFSDASDPRRDRFILSKGHAVSALYAVLERRGLLGAAQLDSFHMDGGLLSGHPDRSVVSAIEASTGSLGHGLPIGLGRAYALSLAGSAARVFVLMSDGEIQEGSVWEAANQASRLGLHNLVSIVDANGLQCFARTEEMMPRASYSAKWEAFGWAVATVDGHDIDALTKTLRRLPFVPGKPSVVIADTIKGKGIAAFEDQLESHYRPPRREDVIQHLKELDA